MVSPKLKPEMPGETMFRYYDDRSEVLDVGPNCRNEFSYWHRLLSGADPYAEANIRDVISQYVEGKIAKHGWTSERWFCSSFIPGPDWRGTPYQPIYDVRTVRRRGMEPVPLVLRFAREGRHCSSPGALTVLQGSGKGRT